MWHDYFVPNGFESAMTARRRAVLAETGVSITKQCHTSGRLQRRFTPVASFFSSGGVTVWNLNSITIAIHSRQDGERNYSNRVFG